LLAPGKVFKFFHTHLFTPSERPGFINIYGSPVELQTYKEITFD